MLRKPGWHRRHSHSVAGLRLCFNLPTFKRSNLVFAGLLLFPAPLTLSPSRAHDQHPGTSPRTPSYHPARLAAGPRRNRMDEHGYRGHRHGRPSSGQRSRHWFCQHQLQPVQRPGFLRRRFANRARYTRLASLRRWPSRRLPPVAGQQYLPQHGHDASFDAPGLVFRPSSPASTHRTAGCGSRGSLHEGAGFWSFPAPSVFRRSSLPAGHEHGPTHRLRARQRQHHQCFIQLGSHLRQMGLPRIGRCRFGLVHGHFPRVFGGRAGELSSLVRPSPSHGTFKDAGQCRLCSHPPPHLPWAARGRANHSRN